MNALGEEVKKHELESKAFWAPHLEEDTGAQGSEAQQAISWIST